MPDIHIVTDSACDLTLELAAQHAIDVVPLSIRFGDEELLDRTQLTPSEFWTRCAEGKALPETAAPSPGAFREAYDRAAASGATAVVCVTLSSKVSATYQSALAGAQEFGEKLPVRVIDSQTLTMGQGLLCIAAAERAAGGMALEQLCVEMEGLVARTRVYGLVGGLEHLQRGGRIGGAKAMLGSLLNIKPILQVVDGEVAEESKQRTRGRALDYLTSKVLDDAPVERIAVCNGASDDIDSIAARLGQVASDHPLVAVDLGPVVGTHTGPATIGLCYITRM